MLISKLGEHHRVVSLPLITEIISTLGEPVDFEDPVQEPIITDRRYRKRLYRDPEDKVLGGIAGGMGAYFNTDPLWFRIIFIALTIFGGSGIIIYLVLWLIIPEARTTAERLEMRGEEININNIERTIKEEMNDIRNRFGHWKKGSDYRKKKDSAGRVIESIVQMAGTLALLFFKFLGGIIGFAILMTFIALFIGLVVPGISFHGFPFLYDLSLHDLLTAVTGSAGIAWLVFTGILLIIFVPMLGMLWAGIRLLFGLRVRSRIMGASLTGIWVTALLFLTVIAIITTHDFSTKSTITSGRTVAPAVADTLTISMYPGAAGRWFEEDDSRRDFKSLSIRYENETMQIIGKPSIEFRQSHNDSVMVVTTMRARGNNHAAANERAREIRYRCHLDSLNISMDQYFLTGDDVEFRNQEVKITIYLPEYQPLQLDPVMQKHYRQIQNLEPLWDNEILDKVLIMNDHKLIEAPRTTTL